MFAQLFSHVQLFATLWPTVHQAPLYMEFSRQEYWSGSPFPIRDQNDCYIFLIFTLVSITIWQSRFKKFYEDK